MTTTTWREELSWAAGFFDGEGSVGCYDNNYRDRTKPYPMLRVSISQHDRFVLERFRTAVGGLGQIHGPHKTADGRVVRYNYCTAKLEHALAVVGLLWRFLSPLKRQQFTLAIKAALARYSTLTMVEMRAKASRERWRQHPERKTACLRGHQYNESGREVRSIHSKTGSPFYRCRQCSADRYALRAYAQRLPVEAYNALMTAPI